MAETCTVPMCNQKAFLQLVIPPRDQGTTGWRAIPRWSWSLTPVSKGKARRKEKVKCKSQKLIQPLILVKEGRERRKEEVKVTDQKLIQPLTLLNQGKRRKEELKVIRQKLVQPLAPMDKRKRKCQVKVKGQKLI